MKTSQKGFISPLLLALIAVLVIGGGAYVYKNKKTEVPAVVNTGVSQSNQVQQQTNNPTSTIKNETADTSKTTGSPRVIACNPKSFDPEYFKQAKPCVSDMSSVDIERENKALAIIAKRVTTDQSLRSFVSSPAQIIVSNQHYQLMYINGGVRSRYVVVDTVAEKVTDYFSVVGTQFIENSSKRFVFLDWSVPQQMFVHLYTLGTEKSVSLSATTIYSPQTYFYMEGPEGSASTKVLASTTDSITVGIYDQNKPLPQKPEDDFVQYQQVGTKVINLSDTTISLP